MDKCVPLVREITFENAEELTEEGLPFLILFRHPDDVQIDKIFTEQVARELFDQKCKYFKLNKNVGEKFNIFITVKILIFFSRDVTVSLSY